MSRILVVEKTKYRGTHAFMDVAPVRASEECSIGGPQVLQGIALAVASEHSVRAVLQKIVQGLAQQPLLDLARIWLLQPAAPDQPPCLHLAASDGTSIEKRRESGAPIDDNSQGIPWNVGKIGRIAATAEPLFIPDARKDAEWMGDAKWAETAVPSFAGQPLIFRGETLGVLAMWCRAPISERGLRWLRLFADHAAVAIANARAFEEIDRLRKQLEMENSYLREEVKVELAFGEIVGQSAAMKRILHQIDTVASTESSVLILGETGTGKELVARAIHDRSHRRERPMIKVNCGAVPRELFESEFFGHIKGAFTGAIRDRAGRFQLADGGTLFLDEIGEIPIELQSKLLRILQEGQFERVGEDVTRRVDVRLIAATNRNLKREMEEGRFREDLYYRLSVFPIEIPPLRQRTGDIPLLAAHFLQQARPRPRARGNFRLTPEQIERLQQYDWPGNIRELQNVIERATIVSRGGPLRLDLALPPFTPPAEPTPTKMEPAEEPEFVSAEDWKQRERRNILAALKRADWRIYGPGGAAELLGLKPTTLTSRMKAMKIKRASNKKGE